MPEHTQITSVHLRRGACFGTCPVYELTLNSDGTAEYLGERFVQRTGPNHGQFNPGDFDKLAGFAIRAGFFEWNDEYRENVTDLPEYRLTVVAGEDTKTVVQYGTDEPPDFWVIAEVVDGIASDVDWMPGAAAGSCDGWSATLTTFGIVAPLLQVRGTCTFPTAGYEVELRRHRPQSCNPDLLLLEKVVTPPSGPAAEVITEVEVIYAERTPSVRRVTILPEGDIVDVQELSEPPSG